MWTHFPKAPSNQTRVEICTRHKPQNVQNHKCTHAYTFDGYLVGANLNTGVEQLKITNPDSRLVWYLSMDFCRGKTGPKWEIRALAMYKYRNG